MNKVEKITNAKIKKKNNSFNMYLVIIFIYSGNRKYKIAPAITNVKINSNNIFMIYTGFKPLPKCLRYNFIIN